MGFLKNYGHLVMKAKKLLQLYAQGKRDFQGENLRGQSFRGKNLSDANFSGADIRSANFTNAYLQGAKFIGTKAGLRRRWFVSLVLLSWILLVFSEFLLCFAALFAVLFAMQNMFESDKSYWFAMYAIIEHISLGFLAILWIVAIKKGILTVCELSLFIFSVAVAFAVAFALAFAGFILFGIAFLEIVVVTFAIAGVVTMSVALTVLICFIYFSWRGIKRNPKDGWICSVAIVFAAMGGTSFRGADLTAADFTDAVLKSTDLRGANLTRTCWRDAMKLNCVRPGDSYLGNFQIRKLVKTGEGQGLNCDRLNLQGIKLQGVNLQDASFIQANLKNADLNGANLSRASLDETNLNGANVTNTRFAYNIGISEIIKQDLIRRGAIFEEIS